MKIKNPFMKPSTAIEDIFAWKIYIKELEAKDPKFAELWERRNNAISALYRYLNLAFISFIIYMLITVIWFFVTFESAEFGALVI